MTAKTMRELMQKEIYFEELLESTIILLKQASKLGMDHLILDLISLFAEKASVEHIMHCVHLGLIVELGRWKKELEVEQEWEKKDRIVRLSRELGERVSGMELISKGVHREL